MRNISIDFSCSWVTTATLLNSTLALGREAFANITPVASATVTITDND